MLFIGANALVPGEVDVDAVLRNPHVESSALAFAKAPLHVVPREQKSICVLQSEAATVPWTAEVCLGSQDATTCVIAIIVCQLGCTVLHFDEGTMEETDYLERALRMADGGADLFLVGGYNDERGTSAEIVQSLLSWFHEQKQRFTLSLACLLSHNTRITDISGRQVPLPVVSGVCITAGERAVRPARFEDRGPMIRERSCRCMASGGTTADLFDAAACEFTVEPWVFSLEARMRKVFFSMSCLGDAALLAQASTSPDAEGPDFPEEMRLTLRLLSEKPETDALFPSAGGKALRFAWDGGAWAPTPRLA
ncbi:protein N-terminal asparagine amidohydrolase [Baffinella frigidus]|nr:protein N-terminal asparagine amidohydrolase [Cryptophyta sp. CCMP2293]